jgi:hypothetical protein
MSGLGSLGYYGGTSGPHPPLVTMRCSTCGNTSTVTATELLARGRRLRCTTKKGLFRKCRGHLVPDPPDEAPLAGT